MAENDLIKSKIGICLSCRKGQQVIRDYHEIYKIIKEKEISEKNMKMAETIRRVLECGDICEGEKTLTQLKMDYKRNEEIKQLIEDAKIELISKQDRNVSTRLFKYNFDESEEATIKELADVLELAGSLLEQYEMLKRLSHGVPFEGEGTMCLNNLHTIIHAIKKLYGDSDEMSAKYQYEVTVLDAMNARNKELGNTYKDCKVELRKNWNDIQGVDKQKMQEAIRYIFEQFCFNDFPRYKIDKNRECKHDMFLIQVESMDSVMIKKKQDVLKRMNNLSEEFRQIVYAYLIYARKKFGSNLQRVMLEQDMTERFISNVGTIGSSTVQYLKGCDIFNLEEEYFKQLCRILLVSEDVLKTGVGKRYGNWKDFFNEECLKEMQESDDFPNINTKKNADDFVKRQIKEIVEMDDTEFDEFLQRNSEHLYEEEYILYTSEWECFEALLHKEEFYTLLEVLERQS